MAKKQTRRSVSLNLAEYRLAEAGARAARQSVAKYTEEALRRRREADERRSAREAKVAEEAEAVTVVYDQEQP